jgi:2'-deoxynucleoside 5'-phosphate N-hydrolase
MKIYFSCSITGGRDDEAVYAALVAHLGAHGHEVLTAHLASARALEDETRLQAEAVYARDCAWVRECDAVIAEVSTPSHGVGYEIGYALEHGKPVLCCYRQDTQVSKMILGNHRPGMRVCPYLGLPDAFRSLEAFLGSLPG